MTRILQITSYPTRRPRHGGQLRAYHTARVLEAAGFELDRMAVFSRAHYPAADDEVDVDLDQARARRRFPDAWPVLDMTTSELAATDEGCFQRFAERISAAAPDIMMLEEPWLWSAVRRWRDGEAGGKAAAPPLIFNAHNIETRAKAAILADANVPEAERIMAEVEALERELAQDAAGVSATTEEDAELMRAWTAGPLVVARNGTVPREVAHLHGILPTPLEPTQRYLMFVGSAHPPNLRGFWDMVIPALPVLRSGDRIVVAGGVAELIARRIAEQGPHYLTRDRLVLLGPVDNLTLDCLLCNAAGILLPITYGGGSNLKTAEALLSCLPIVATEAAFRGYGALADRPGVLIARTTDAFGAAMRRVLRGEVPSPTPDPALSSLLWDQTLQPLVTMSRGIAGSCVRERNGCVSS